MFKFSFKPKLKPIKDIADLYHKVLVDVESGRVGVVNVGGKNSHDSIRLDGLDEDNKPFCHWLQSATLLDKAKNYQILIVPIGHKFYRKEFGYRDQHGDFNNDYWAQKLALED